MLHRVSGTNGQTGAGSLGACDSATGEEAEAPGSQFATRLTSKDADSPLVVGGGFGETPRRADKHIPSRCPWVP